MIKLRSNSAMASMMTTTARPAAHPVSICLRKLTNSKVQQVQPVEQAKKVLHAWNFARKTIFLNR